FLKLLIDENPYSLECPRRRVLAWLARANGVFHDLGKLSGGVESSPRSSRNNRSCNLPSKPFFAIGPDYLLDVVLRSGRQPLRGCDSAAHVHPHVERPTQPETEPAPAVLELRRRHAQVHQHAIHTSDPLLRQRFAQPTEARVQRYKPRIRDRLRCLYRLGV